MHSKLLASALFFLVAACAGAQKTPPASPSATPDTRADAMVAAADVRAVDAGLEMLRRGGSAVDAAIASMMVLGLVEPQSAGLGGGGFMITFDAQKKDLDAFDGREVAPAAATDALFLDAEGKVLPFGQAVASGRSTGTPALIPMLKLAHERHGRLRWSELFGPAIRLADSGFAVSPRLHGLLEREASLKVLHADPAARAYFFNADGSAPAVGQVLKNPAYAATLRAIQKDGPRALQEGPIAEAIVAAIAREPRPGRMTLADIRAYKPRELEPICGPYRTYTVCGMGPPSSGGVAVLSILGLYERVRPTPVGPESADDWSAFLWASRIAYADRDHYVADDSFVPVPTKALIDGRYLDLRAKQIAIGTAPLKLAAGDPSTVLGGPSYYGRWGTETSGDVPGTTHLSIVDPKGNAVALTATIEGPFGSRRMAGGFLLNNQLTDFSLAPTKGGLPVANAPAGGKRPRSSMAPTIILDPQGDFYASVGSPGGSSIIAYVAKTVIGAVDWNLTMQQAADLPNLIARGPLVTAETGRMSPALRDGLSERGWKLRPVAVEASGVHAIRKLGPGQLEGAADPRREGVAKALQR